MRLWCALLLVVNPAWAGVQVQKQGLTLPPVYLARRDDAQKLFETSYAAYKQYAFGHDDVSPVSLKFSDGRSNWGASIVDAMPTMYIMGLESLFNEAVNFSINIDFSQSKTRDTVSLFETTIRYIGGLVSAYELSGKNHTGLLGKAQQLADKMAHAWVGANDVPYGFMNFSTDKPVIGTSNIAEAGTLSLEWYTLSKYTGNLTYADLTARSVAHIASLPAPLPGLAAQGIDPTSGNSVGGYVTWGGGSDSYFEYLLKYARLTNTNDPIFMNTWKTAVDSSIRYLLRNSTVGNHVYLADLDSSGKILHVGSHLACFHAGNWLLGGKLLQNQTIVDIALALNDGCWNTYASTVTRIGPEAFAYISSDGGYTGGSPASLQQLLFYEEHGFYITSSQYIMRPEVLESNFHAWRITGDTKYLDRAGAAIDAFNRTMRATVAYAGLNNVNSGNGGLIDDMQSFWLAEVLKYLYLTFDDPERISLEKYVFNTECQPFEAPPALSSYRAP